VPERRLSSRAARHVLGSRWLTVGAGLGLMAAVLLTLAGLAAYERGRIFERASERNELLARVFADHATRNIDATAQATATLAELLQRGLSPDGPEMRAALAQTLVNLPFLRGLDILDAQGLIVGSADGTELNHRVPLAALGQAPAPGRDMLGPFVAARRLLDLARGVMRTPTPPGVGFLPLVRGVALPDGQRLQLVALLNTEAFANFQQVTMNDERAAAALLSYDGHLIAASASVKHAVGDDLSALPPFRDFLPRLEQGSWRGAGLRAEPQIAAFRVSATRPLVVLVEFGEAAAQGEWLRRSRGLAAAAAVAALVIGAMTRIASRSVRARESARRELEQAQSEALRRERDLSVTFRSLQELIFRTDTAGAITFVNAHWTTLTAADTAQARGMHLWDLVQPSQRDAAHALFTPASNASNATHASARRLQAVIVDARGELHSCDISVMPLLDGGRLQGFAGSAIDVSERVRAEQRLQAQLAFTELLMEVSPLPSSVVDLQRRYVLVNQAWERFTGHARSQVIGQAVGGHLPPAEQRVHEEQDQRLLASGRPLRYEAQMTQQDGSARDVVVNKLLLPGADGQPEGILSVIVDVTEFRNAERATREARDAAEEASRTKSEFIANISHELRTPLQSIIGFSELGVARGGGQPRLGAMFADIHGAGQRMLALVNDLLDVAKIESTVGTIHLERCDLRGLVREVLRELDPLLAPRGLRIALALPEQPLRARVDPPRFQQVVRNVLANAIRFSPQDGCIELSGAFTAAGEPHLVIADQGAGIPPAELESIFEAFVQSSLTKDGAGGTGLGLAICRKIVTAFGGRIHARNRDGGGAEFHILLPARDAGGSGETLPMPL
jgi:PAS domain S-box-containing protein